MVFWLSFNGLLFTTGHERRLMKLSMIVPAYNEEDNVRPFYDEAVRVFGETDLICEIIFIDDGSKDKTR